MTKKITRDGSLKATEFVVHKHNRSQTIRVRRDFHTLEMGPQELDFNFAVVASVLPQEIIRRFDHILDGWSEGAVFLQRLAEPRFGRAMEPWKDFELWKR